MVDSYFTCGISSSIKRNLERQYVSRMVDASRFPMAERLRSLAGPAARNVMSQKTVMPARSSATLC
jgi:hypothetical protein